jgi:WD40 repeat protein
MSLSCCRYVMSDRPSLYLSPTYIDSTCYALTGFNDAIVSIWVLPDSPQLETCRFDDFVELCLRSLLCDEDAHDCDVQSGDKPVRTAVWGNQLDHKEI